MTTIRATRPPSLSSSEAAGTPDEGARHPRLALWLAAAAIFTLLLPIGRAARVARNEAARREAQAAGLAATVTAVAAAGADAAVQAPLAAARATGEAFAGVRQAMATRYVDWAAVLGAVGQYDPEHLALMSLAQEGMLLKVQGLADSDAAVVAYVDRVEASGLFRRVSLESIENTAGTPLPGLAATASPSATPGPTATPPPSASPTPAAPAGDAYEATDGLGMLMVPGTSQARTFHAAGDVDRARFVAKSGRTYRVSTEGLQGGVDTVLTVRAGWMVLTNDDQHPGTLASEVILTVPAGADLDATIEVTNRGVAGDEQAYKLVLAEVTATPAPTGAPATALPPTATAMPAESPTPAATPTFDLRDAFEPDDAPQDHLSLGSAQMRSFYPAGDVDRALLAAEAGRTYRVFTHGLAPDVDTFLAVRANGTVYVNDNRAPGEVASEVTFEALPGYSDPVVIEVTNRGRFGPAQWYRLEVEEVTSATLTPPQNGASSAVGAPRAAWQRGRWFAVEPPARAWPAARQSGAGLAAVPAPGLTAPRVRFVLILEVARP